MVARSHRQAVQAALLIGLLACPVSAQEPVNKAADYVSWATAGANATGAIVEAIRSDDTKCHLARLAISEAIGMGAAFTFQHLIVSPRPCLGCAPNGWPSAHVTQSVLGSTASAKRLTWGFSVGVAVGTAEGRDRAHRHTRAQQAAGMVFGSLAELAGQKLLRCRE